MHLLAGEAARIDDGDTAVDLTQTPGDNSTKLATTAYVQAAIYATTTLPASKSSGRSTR